MRKVEITIGIPDNLVDPEEPHPDKMQDCYCINFTPDKDGDLGFSAHGACLCSLGQATEAWLNGASIQEVESIMSAHGPEEDGEN